MTKEQEIAIIEAFGFIRRFWDDPHDATNPLESFNLSTILQASKGFIRRFWDDPHDATNPFEACNIVLKLKDSKIPESIINAFINNLE